MYRTLAFVLLFATSALAQEKDAYDAHSRVLSNASIAFEVIWAIAGLILLIFVLKSLSRLPSMSTRIPYIPLVAITFVFMLYNVLCAVFRRASESMEMVPSHQLSAAIGFVYAVMASFLPAMVLYTIQRQGTMLRETATSATLPIACQTWKRILDWFLVGATFFTYIASLGIRIAVFRAFESRAVFGHPELRYSKARQILGHTTTALEIVLCLDAIVSLFIHARQTKRANSHDLVNRRLIIIAAPFLAIYVVESFIVDVYGEFIPAYDGDLQTLYTILSVDLAAVIIDGACRTSVIAALITIMGLPNAQWTPQVLGSTLSAGGSVTWSGMNEPLYEKSQP